MTFLLSQTKQWQGDQLMKEIKELSKEQSSRKVLVSADLDFQWGCNLPFITFFEVSFPQKTSRICALLTLIHLKKILVTV